MSTIPSISRRSRRATAIAAASLGALLMSACGADGGTDADGSSPTSSVSADPPIDDGGVAALPD